ETAKLLERPVDHRGDVGRLAHVAAETERLHAELLELRGGLLAALHLARTEDDVRAQLRQSAGHLAADAAAAARDDRGPSRQLEQVLDAHRTCDANCVAEQAELRAAYRSFMEDHIHPVEVALARDDEEAERLLADLRSRAKAAGLWAPHLPPDAGGTGRGFLAYADLNEEIGR